MKAPNQTTLKSSFSILNSVLGCIFIIYLTDVFSDYLTGWLGLLAIPLLIGLKVWFIGGFWGSLLEIISGEEYLLDLGRFKKNARLFWKPILIVISIPYFVSLLVNFILLIKPPLPASLIATHLNLPLTYFLVLYLINQKYLKEHKISQVKTKINIDDVLIMFLLYSVECLLFYSPMLEKIAFLAQPNVVSFLTRYIQVFEFIYLAGLIVRQYPALQESFKNPKELFLIHPINGGIMEGLGSLMLMHHPPFFVVLKALTPSSYKIRKFNKVIWQNRYYQPNKLVAISCYTSSCSEAYKMAREFRKQGSTVVLGGPHVSYLPDEALEFCDCVVIGEAEGVWAQVVQDYENGKLQKKYTSGRIDECHEVVFNELLQSPPEQIRDFLELTRGCKFKCRFCAIPFVAGPGIQKNPVFDVVELINKIKQKYNHVFFIDNNLYNDPAYAKELFEAFKPLKIHWSTACTIDIAKNEELLKLAKESGCASLLIGYEVIGSSKEKSQGGKFSMTQKYLEYSEKIKKAGISIKAHFILGYSAETVTDLFRMWLFCFKLRPRLTCTTVFTPIPSTDLFHKILDEKRILTLNWRNYAFHSVVFKPENIHPVLLKILYPITTVILNFTTSTWGFVFFVLVIFAIAGMFFM